MKKQSKATIPEKRNKGGRPRKYTDKEIFEKKIEEYFNDCDKKGKPYTMSGLAYSLGMDRRSLLNYSKDDKFFPTIKIARDRVETYVEEQLYGNKQTAGVIFSLKNNFGWKDKQEIEQKVQVNPEDFWKDAEV